MPSSPLLLDTMRGFATRKADAAHTDTWVTRFWERAETETSWKACFYSVQSSNMETSLILLVVVEMDVIKYKNSHSQQVCKQTMTLIMEEYPIVALTRYASRTTISIDSQVSCFFSLFFFFFFFSFFFFFLFRIHVVSVQLKQHVMTATNIMLRLDELHWGP